MTGPEHYQAAERLLAAAKAEATDSFVDDIVMAAQVHATLALAAGLGLGLASAEPADADVAAWYEVAGTRDVTP